MNKNRVKRFILLCLAVILITMSNYVYAAEGAILGDINRDRKVDSIDLLYMMRHIVAENKETHKGWILKNDKYMVADITQNGIVNSSDMLIILIFLLYFYSFSRLPKYTI